MIETWRGPRNNEYSHVIKKKIGTKVFNKKESLSSSSGKEIGLKSSTERDKGKHVWCVI